MPTGYTGGVEDGTMTEFKDFAMLCARAFGALISMRDTDLDAKIPEEFKVDPYHVDAIKKAVAESKRVNAMSGAEASREAKKEFDKFTKERAESIERNRVENERYRTMLDKVLRWKPPTKDHEGLKKFMVEQIEMCMRNWSDGYTVPVLKTGEAWVADQLARCGRDITYHTEEHAKEVQRAKERTEWVKQLRDSLK